VVPLKRVLAVGGSWGVLDWSSDGAWLELAHGALKIASLRLPNRPVSINLDGKLLSFEEAEAEGYYEARLAQEVELEPGHALEVGF
jgi:hypothetical protein